MMMSIPSIPLRFKRFLRTIIGSSFGNNLGKYLGCNVEVDGRSTNKFSLLLKKVRKKAGDWKFMTLSHTERVMLIDEVLASLCHHVLSVFLLSKLIADKMNVIFRTFFWRKSKGLKPIIYCRSRYILRTPKSVGGLGIRNIHQLNIALLAKQAFQIHINPHLLVSQVLKVRCKESLVNLGVRGSMLGASSWGFRGLYRVVRDCREGFIRVIKSGKNTSIS